MPLPPLPGELYLLLIDALGHDATAYGWGIPEEDVRQAKLALQQCALVCSIWRPRAQRWLFQSIRLHNPEVLHRLAAVLNSESLRLAEHIQHLDLTCGYSGKYWPWLNVATLFSRLVYAPLPAVRSVILRNNTSIATEYPGKPLPHLALHPRDLRFYSACWSVTVLELDDIHFGSFADFARLLSCYPALEVLKCVYVDWKVLGVIPGFMRRERSRFLSHLRTFQVSVHPTH